MPLTESETVEIVQVLQKVLASYQISEKEFILMHRVLGLTQDKSVTWVIPRNPLKHLAVLPGSEKKVIEFKAITVNTLTESQITQLFKNKDLPEFESVKGQDTPPYLDLKNTLAGKQYLKARFTTPNLIFFITFFQEVKLSEVYEVSRWGRRSDV